MELDDYLALRYTIELRRDEDGDWIARVRELKGCTADGPTMAAALEDLEQAKREWLTAAIEDGVPIPPPETEDVLPSGKWVQRVPKTLHRSLTQLAKREGTSLNSLVASILAEHVGARRAAATTATTQLAAWCVGSFGGTGYVAHQLTGVSRGGRLVLAGTSGQLKEIAANA